MTRERLWSLAKLILKLGFTAVSLYLVFSKVSFSDLKAAFIDSNPAFFLIAFVVFTGSQVLTSSRLNTYFRGVGLYISERYNFKLFLLGMFYNLFLPGGIGGDGYKIFFLRKKFRIKGRRVLTAIFFDRLSGLWALCVITAALVIFLPQLPIYPYLPAEIVLVGSVAYYIVLKRYFADYSQNVRTTHIKALGVQSLQIITVIFILYALRFEGKFAPYLLMFLVSSLVAIFPFTVGGLGAREVVFLYGAEYFDLDPHLAVLISLLFYCISALLSLLGSYLIFNPQSLDMEQLPKEKDDHIQEIEDILKKDT